MKLHYNFKNRFQSFRFQKNVRFVSRYLKKSNAPLGNVSHQYENLYVHMYLVR